MDCKWLEDFLALSQHGNYSQAAAQRHITQPALSRRIKALEEVLRHFTVEVTGARPVAEASTLTTRTAT